MLKPMFILAAAVFAVPLATPAIAQDAAMPMCSAKVTDSCQQTPKQEARAMSGAQVDARDARNGGMWTPDGKAPKAKKAMKAAMAPDAMEATPPQ